MNSGRWRTAHASVIGAAHLAQNAECQDRFVCRTVETREGELLIAAVADGAGSTSHGQIGAEIACQVFAEQVEKFLSLADASLISLNENFGKHWLAYFQSRVAELAQAQNKPIRDFASTFIGAVIAEKRASFFQVGDGASVYADTNGKYLFAIPPIDSEYANVTDFLTDPTAFESLRFSLVETEIEDVILFSDGIFPVAVDYKINQPHAPFLQPMIAPLKKISDTDNLNAKLENFLASEKLNEKTDDDKTIILATKIRV